MVILDGLIPTALRSGSSIAGFVPLIKLPDLREIASVGPCGG